MITPARKNSQVCRAEWQERVFLFGETGIGDCRYIYPPLPEIREVGDSQLFSGPRPVTWIWPNSRMCTAFLTPCYCFRKGQEISRFISRDRKVRNKLMTFLGLK